MKRPALHLPLLPPGLALLALVALLGALRWYTAEPPNYALIEPGLYVGGWVPSPPPGTKAVVNLCERDDPYRADFHLHEPIRDAAPAPDLAWLEEMVGYVSRRRQEGLTTFIHCQNGVSRSGMLVVAYLMQDRGWGYDDTLAFVQKRRPIVRPNPAFRVLLRRWEERLGG